MARQSLMRWLAYAGVLGVLVAALAVAWSGQSLGATQRLGFAAEADAYVYQSNPDQNYGRSTSLRADGSPVMRSYLRFNVQGLSGSVTKATLWVYAESAHRDGYEVRPVADTSWDELKVTYNTAPPVGSSVIARSGGFAAGQWTVVDVTPLVKGNGAISLALTTKSSTQMKLTSRELGTNPPQLVVETTSSSTGSTPSATPTPTPAPGSGSTPTPTPTPPSTGGGNPSFPIRAAFYYPWFPEAWKQSGIFPYTRYHPSLGYYDTADPAVIKQHIAAMQYGQNQAGIASWWGQGHHTDNDFAVILKATDGTGFKWTIYHEQEGQRDLSTSEIRSDLTYIRDKYASDPDYLRVNGKFVVFVYNADDSSCEVADRWVPVARELGAYLVLKVFSGYRNCANQPDSWHQYSPAVATDHQKGYSYTISPGFWHREESQPRLSRDLARWQQNVRDMVASGEPWQLITTFNEWGEGTSVESAEEWKTSSGYGAYLDALHSNGQGTGGTSPTPTPTPAPTPTPTPGTTPTPTPTPTPPPSSGDPVVVVAAGDIACDPASSSWNNNNGTSSACRHKYTAQVAAAQGPDYVFVLGDTQYEDGALSKYQQSYDPTWGQLKSVTRPVPGNHEYLTSGAAGYYDYFGSLAGDRSKGYYAVDLGNGWIAIAVNSNCSQVGGCTAGSPQYNFVKSVLEANASKNVIVYMHHPYWSTGKYHNCCDSSLTDLYKLFTQYDVEISLAGHDHNYQRHAPQRWDGTKDPNGIRHFVNGAGGKNVQDVDANKAANNWEFADETHFGVLVLKLYPDRYEWAFVSDSGAVLDSGSYKVQN